MIPKFRAWDSWRKRMSVVDRFYIDTKGVRLYDDFGEYWRDFSDATLMQSTGLFDKNGKEIFEGDIITNGEAVVDVKSHPTLGFYTVVNDSECFFGSNTSIKDFENDVEEFSSVTEIIGNIYENPELLEVKE